MRSPNVRRRRCGPPPPLRFGGCAPPAPAAPAAGADPGPVVRVRRDRPGSLGLALPSPGRGRAHGRVLAPRAHVERSHHLGGIVPPRTSPLAGVAGPVAGEPLVGAGPAHSPAGDRIVPSPIVRRAGRGRARSGGGRAAGGVLVRGVPGPAGGCPADGLVRHRSVRVSRSGRALRGPVGGPVAGEALVGRLDAGGRGPVGGKAIRDPTLGRRLGRCGRQLRAGAGLRRRRVRDRRQRGRRAGPFRTGPRRWGGVVRRSTSARSGGRWSAPLRRARVTLLVRPQRRRTPLRHERRRLVDSRGPGVLPARRASDRRQHRLPPIGRRPVVPSGSGHPAPVVRPAVRRRPVPRIRPPTPRPGRRPVRHRRHIASRSTRGGGGRRVRRRTRTWERRRALRGARRGTRRREPRGARWGRQRRSR